MWFVKSKRAQTSDDDETWVAGGVAPTLNAFDMGDTRATVIIFEATRVDDVRIYPNYSPTVATYWGTGGARVPYVFPIQGTVIGRSDEAGPQGKGYREDGEVMFTLDRVSGHAIAFSHNQGLDPQASEEASPTLRSGGNGMAVAYDEFNDSISDIHQTLRAGTKQSTGVIESTVRRLTPTECERLQGFPDGWTDGQADSHRYKQMGNAVAVPVVQWIIDRLVK